MFPDMMTTRVFLAPTGVVVQEALSWRLARAGRSYTAVYYGMCNAFLRPAEADLFEHAGWHMCGWALALFF